MDSLRIEATDEVPPSLKEVIRKVSETDEVKIAAHSIEILTLHGRRILPRIIKTLGDNDIRIKSVEVEEPNLESVFLHLTGRELRD
ncbi:MAG: hypothetical protein KAW42_06800, partial [Candidatus Atribacteria bacterium]|nr:hypothetical protein [Candidatus Atribacteria bacterium]